LADFLIKLQKENIIIISATDIVMFFS